MEIERIRRKRRRIAVIRMLAPPTCRLPGPRGAAAYTHPAAPRHRAGHAPKTAQESATPNRPMPEVFFSLPDFAAEGAQIVARER